MSDRRRLQSWVVNSNNVRPNSGTSRSFMNQNSQITEQIKLKVAEGLLVLAPHLQDWVRAHLIDPRPVRFAADAEGSSLKDLWLVTDHTGEKDSSYRIVYDEHGQMFGLEVTLAISVEWYMGSYGSFAETVESM